MMKICSKCGIRVEGNDNFCIECGAPLVQVSEQQDGQKICPVCGGEISSKAQFCILCGASLEQQMQPQVAEYYEQDLQTIPNSEDFVPEKTQSSGGKTGLIITIAALGTVLTIVIICLIIFGSMLMGGQKANKDSYHWDGDYLVNQNGEVFLHIDDIKDRPNTYVDEEGRLIDSTGIVLMEPEKYKEYIESLKQKKSSYHFTRSNGNWYDAQDGAYQRGGYLVSINDYDEFQKVCQLAEREGVVVFWVGARRNAVQSWNDVRWEDGEYLTYTNWYQGEPSGRTAEGDEELFLMVFKVQGRWYFNDAPCDVAQYYKNKMGYITEIEE